MRHLLKAKEEAEHLRAGLDRYSHLWQSDRMAVFQEFLSYSRQLGPEELEPEKTPPTLKDFQREVRHSSPVITCLHLSSLRLERLICGESQ